MGTYIKQIDINKLEKSIVNIANVLLACDSDCNGCPLKKVINIYDECGNRMNECDLLMKLVDNI